MVAPISAQQTAPASAPDHRTITRPCPLCDALPRHRLYQRDGWTIVRCDQCQMVFLDGQMNYETQRDDHDWIDDYEKETARRTQKHPLVLALSNLVKKSRPETNQRLLNQTTRWKDSGKLIDFGCGDGSFLARAAQQFDVSGIELSPRLAERARQKIDSAKIKEGPLTEVANEKFPAAQFDVVTQFGYIEHEWQPLAGLQAAHRLLKPGGVTVLKTPNFASWNRTVMGLDWCGFHIPAHCNYFTPDSLAKMLRRAGLEPLPRPLADTLPTSDSLWIAARKPA
ncbi:MAG TPA: class I SAM-dependent methyltransferase [Candidatus Acidoferrales bacterium]